MQPGSAAAFAECVRATAELYRASGKFAYHYVGSKLRRDPVAQELFRLAADLPFGKMLDIGCGRGQFSACLLQSGLAQSAIGIDVSRPLLAQAESAMHGFAFQPCHQDLSSDHRLPGADTVLLIDVLYQLPTAAQSRLLAAATRAARHRLIVRAASPAEGFRSLVTKLLERGFRRVWPHSGREVNAQPIDDIVVAMRAGGLRTSVAPCWKGTPFSNTLVVGERP